MDVKINDYERVDDLQLDGLKIIQDPKRFCFGIDAILLSHFAKLKRNEKMVDLGTGTGIVPILMSGVYPDGEQYIGVEIQDASFDLASRSVLLNDIGDKVSIVKGDIKNVFDVLPKNSYNVVTSNPPYMPYGGALENDYEPKTIARHEVLCTLDDVVKAAAGLLKVKGRFYMVHKPARIPEIFNTMSKYGIEPKRMRLVHPYVDKEPNMVLIEGLKGGSKELRVLPPLVVYKDKNVYTDEIYEIYGMDK